jgi:hypothetical protein
MVMEWEARLGRCLRRKRYVVKPEMPAPMMMIFIVVGCSAEDVVSRCKDAEGKRKRAVHVTTCFPLK